VLSLHLLHATNLPAKDLNGFSDPYVVFQIGHQRVQSKTIKKTLNPVFNQNFMMHCNLKDKLHIEVWDMDVISRDDEIAKIDVELANFKLEDEKEHVIHLPLPQGELTFQLTYTSLSH